MGVTIKTYRITLLVCVSVEGTADTKLINAAGQKTQFGLSFANLNI